MGENLRNHDPTEKAYVEWRGNKRQRRALYSTQPDGTFTSEFPTVQAFINRSKAKRLKGLEMTLKEADKFFRFLEYKRPDNWTADDLNRYVATVGEGSKYGVLVCIRRVAPHLKSGSGSAEGLNAISPTDFKEINVKRYELYTAELNRALDHMDEIGMRLSSTIIRAHMVWGCREGSNPGRGGEDRSGLLGVKWSNVNFTAGTADIYEGKVKKGILWKGCPLDLFGWNLPERLKEIKGKTTLITIADHEYAFNSSGEFVVGLSYEGLRALYNLFESILKTLFPNSQFDDVTPHTGRHLHVNLLAERGVPLEYIAGDAEGGRAYVGVGWTDLTTLKRHYLTLSERMGLFRSIISAAREKSPALAVKMVSEAKERSVEA
jgi:integrase